MKISIDSISVGFHKLVREGALFLSGYQIQINFQL